MISYMVEHRYTCNGVENIKTFKPLYSLTSAFAVDEFKQLFLK